MAGTKGAIFAHIINDWIDKIGDFGLQSRVAARVDHCRWRSTYTGRYANVRSVAHRLLSRQPNRSILDRVHFSSSLCTSGFYCRTASFRGVVLGFYGACLLFSVDSESKHLVHPPKPFVSLGSIVLNTKKEQDIHI